MNVAQAACALSGQTPVWDLIDWTHAEREVRRLQARIVRAVQASRRGKVKALQRLLTCSFYDKALAVKQVTETGQAKRRSGRRPVYYSGVQVQSHRLVAAARLPAVASAASAHPEGQR